MTCLHYHNNTLLMDSVDLNIIAARFGTPCYVYSATAIKNHCQALEQAFKPIPHRICYAVKANSNIAILHLLAQLGLGFDIVSMGELARVLKAQGDAQKVIFSGVCKRTIELEYAIQAGIYCIDVESAEELTRVNQIAMQFNKVVNIALRVNPNIDAGTHAYIATGRAENKFGIPVAEVLTLSKTLAQYSHVRLIGLATHIGSQILDLKPIVAALKVLLELYRQLKNAHDFKFINLGGGLGIQYHQEKAPRITEYANAIIEHMQPLPLTLILEPGRYIIGNAGVLLTRVEYIKQTTHKHFAIVDAGMNDLLRPALYQAWQRIVPVNKKMQQLQLYDIVGPVCESADILGTERELNLESGDLLAIEGAGAYGFSMSSNYNSRCKPAEILIHDTKASLIRPRETIDELFATENII